MLWLWTLVKPRISASGAVQRGIYFGLIFWLISLPGMVMSYASFPLSAAIVLSWSVSGLFESISAGIIYGKFRA